MSNYLKTAPTQLVSRHGYSSTGGVTDMAKKAGDAIWCLFSSGEKAKGQAELLKQQAAAKQVNSGGLPPWLPLVAIAGVGLYLYSRKK